MDSIDIPEWFTTKFLENILTKEKDVEKIEVIKHDISRCVPKGANFLSNIIRVNVVYREVTKNGYLADEQISLVVKLPLEDDALAFLNKSGIIEREVEAYYDLLPKLNEIVTSHGDAPLTPKCYKCDVEGVLIMQDLSADSYKMINKWDQLDFDHGVAVLKRMARFHAASVSLHERDPNLVEIVGRHLIFNNDMDPDVKTNLDPLQGEVRIKDLIIEFEKWPETREHVTFLRKLKPKFWESLINSLCNYDKDELLALNHGDVYTNNILFLYNKNDEILDLKFVDLQLLRYTCPVIDILYFIYTSIKLEVIESHYEELVQCYLQNINFYLEKYKCLKRWDEEKFKKSLERQDIYSVIISITLLPFMFADKDQISKEPKYPYFEFVQNEKYRKTCAKILDRFSKKLWFQNF